MKTAFGAMQTRVLQMFWLDPDEISYTALSKSIMWEARRPIDAGHIFEGRALGSVLRSHTSSFTTITSVPAEMVQSGTEPLLSTDVRAKLFAIAHNALTNAFLHARAHRVEFGLDFQPDHIRLSVSDDGIFCLLLAY